jgi:ankyrin repeat protein
MFWDDDVPMTNTDEAARTPLHYAALTDDAREAEARLTAGDGPEAPDFQCFTPLHFAAQAGAPDVARVLLERGASVDPTNDFGNTQLFTAVI